MSEEKVTLFSQQMAYINKGTLDSEATETLAKLVKAVRETGKKGSVTINLTVSMLNTCDETAVKITPSIKQVIPELDRAETIMFSTHDGDLLRDDPDQMQMDLRVVNTTAPTPIKLQQNG